MAKILSKKLKMATRNMARGPEITRKYCMAAFYLVAGAMATTAIILFLLALSEGQQ